MPRKSNVSGRSRRYVFTLFWSGANAIISLRRLLGGREVKYGVFGREICPDTNRRHCQGYVIFNNARRPGGVRKFFGKSGLKPHVEIAKGNHASNLEYCKKDGDFEEFGKPPVPGHRSDLDDIKAQIEAGASERTIAEQHFSKWVVYRRSFSEYRRLLQEPVLRPQLRVYAIVGAPGVGKTRFVYEHSAKVKEKLFIVDDATLTWFDGYNGQGIALIDDYRGGGRFEFLLRLLDIYPLQVPVKGSFVNWSPKIIFITSNEDPEHWHREKDYAPLKRRIHGIARVTGGDATTYDTVRRFIECQFGLGGGEQRIEPVEPVEQSGFGAAFQ